MTVDCSLPWFLLTTKSATTKTKAERKPNPNCLVNDRRYPCFCLAWAAVEKPMCSSEWKTWLALTDNGKLLNQTSRHVHDCITDSWTAKSVVRLQVRTEPKEEAVDRREVNDGITCLTMPRPPTLGNTNTSKTPEGRSATFRVQGSCFLPHVCFLLCLFCSCFFRCCCCFSLIMFPSF